MKRSRFALIAAGLAAAAAMPGINAPTVTSSDKPAINAVAAQTETRRTYKRRRLLAGRVRSGYRTPFITNGNRAQRARQMAGMILKNN